MTFEDERRAVNEGFADLFAFYASGAESELIANVDCFAMSRDVSSSKFADGQKKVLSDQVLQIYYSTQVASRRKCEHPHFQDEHAIGAIVAYGIHQVLSNGAFEEEDVVGAGGELLRGWVDRLRALLQTADASEITLSAMLREAMLVVQSLNSDGHLTAAQCSTMREIFPTYGDEWLNPGLETALQCGGG